MLAWDLMRAVDYLMERGEWDLDAISCLGFSGGGMQTLSLIHILFLLAGKVEAEVS